MTLGGTVQVAAGQPIAWMYGLWTPQFAARQTHLCPSQPHFRPTKLLYARPG